MVVLVVVLVVVVVVVVVILVVASGSASGSGSTSGSGSGSGSGSSSSSVGSDGSSSGSVGSDGSSFLTIYLHPLSPGRLTGMNENKMTFAVRPMTLVEIHNIVLSTANVQQVNLSLARNHFNCNVLLKVSTF